MAHFNKNFSLFLPLFFSASWAQHTHGQTTAQTTASTTAPQQLEPVTITSKAAPVLEVDRADVSGFGLSLLKTPQSISVLSSDLLNTVAAQTLSQAIKLDASLADSYNTTGYIESISVRGFLLNQKNNFRRDGLAISNYAPLAFEGIEQIEILKGVAGLLAGVSAPGGLLQTITKKPQRETFTTLTVSGDQYGSAKAHIDTNIILNSGIGVRLNIASEKLQSHFDHTNGERQFASMSVAVPMSAATSISIGADYHTRSQRDVPGLGLLDTNGDGVGDTLPRTINPRLNLNNQSWSLPYQSKTTTAQIALDHRFTDDWNTHLAANTQRSRINDRIAFPDGCSNAAVYVYPGLCANGDVDIYDFRSEGERRTLTSWDAHLDGRINVATMEHKLRIGMNGRTVIDRLPAFEAYNYVGSTNIFNPIAVASDPALTSRNTNGSERTLEGYASINSSISAAWQTFVGVRVSRFKRDSAVSDGSEATQLSQTVSTPWAGLSFAPTTTSLLYASWGEGAELESVPNRPLQYVNSGAVLPALKSRQIEIGGKWQIEPRLLMTMALFDIKKPYTEDQAAAQIPSAPGAPGAKLVRMSGSKEARHRGLELNMTGRVNEAFSLQASATALDAAYVRANDQSLIGKRITNIPRLAASIFADYKITAISGLAFNALLTLRDSKTATSDGSVKLPRSGQLDLGTRYLQRLASMPMHPLLWRLNIENATNRIYWREAPIQSWGGIYLFPSTPRTVRMSLSTDW